MINPKLRIKNYPPLMEEIKKVLKSVSYGSVEIYVQNSKVTQMTVRKIVKTKYNIEEDENLAPEKTLKDTLAKSGIDIKTIQISQRQAQNRVLTKDNR